MRASTSWDADNVTKALILDLKTTFLENKIRPDAVFFTGDAAFGNDEKEDLKSQYEKFGLFLDEVRNVYEPILEKSRIFIVPGNHDVDRNKVFTSDTEWLRNPQRKAEEIINALRQRSPMSQHWMSRLTSYRQFLIDYGLDHLTPQEPNLIWSHAIQIDGASIAIVGLNSAWSCASNKEKALLWMGGEWQIAELRNRIGKPDLSFALIHHPSNWLNEQEDPIVGRLLDQSFDVILHGHEHREFILQDVSGNLKISAGACYDRSTYFKGYSVGSMLTDGSGGKLFLRTWDEIGGGWVAKNIAVKAPTGCYQIRPLERSKSSLTIHNISHAKKDNQIITLSGPPSKIAIDAKTSLLRRRPFVFQKAHSRVRANERVQFEEILSSGKIGWLEADWQMGKDGFIGSVLNAIGSIPALENVYRIDCGAVCEIEDIFEDASSQLGMTFVEFAAVVEHIDQATLILEDVPPEMLRNLAERTELIQKLKSTIIFVPSLRIIVTARQWPENIGDPRQVSLRPLDGPDLSRYLNAHSDAKEVLKRKDRFEDVLAHTGGLPSVVDRLISKCNILPLDELLDDHTALAEEEINEKIPKTLEIAVARVFDPQSENDRRKLSLLKLMTVLKDGETFEGLRRAFPGKPVNKEALLSLAENGLIEVIPVARRAMSLIPAVKGADSSDLVRSDRLLRVPRQVRDYVERLIPNEEKNRIYNTVSEALFGIHWYEGKLKLRRAIILAYRESTVAGPGSELLVAQYLLKYAIDRKSKERTKRYARLAVNYCTELIDQDRFRDGMIASRAIMSLLNEEAHYDEWVDCAFAYGKAARMTGNHQESVDVLERILGTDKIRTKEFISLVSLQLAWNFDKLDREKDALRHAQICIDQTYKQSDLWFQATALILKIQNGGSLPQKISSSLYQAARNLGHDVAANNIALEWAKNTTSKKEAIRLLDDVINGAKDRYNQTRAIVDKANLLRRSNRIGQLTGSEQLRLCDAYEYSCAQRIPRLLDACHDALWEFCIQKGFWAGMFRLFKFSSFVWCLTDRSVKENKYIPILTAARQEPGKINEIEVESEIEYLDRRIALQQTD